MPTSQKPETPSSDFEDDSHDFSLESKFRVFHIVDTARLALTVLALAAGITILGVSADSIAVYNATHVADNFMLPLWPIDFDLRPTVALVVGSAVVVLANSVSIVASKTQTVSLPLPRIRYSINIMHEKSKTDHHRHRRFATVLVFTHLSHLPPQPLHSRLPLSQWSGSMP